MLSTRETITYEFARCLDGETHGFPALKSVIYFLASAKGANLEIVFF